MNAFLVILIMLLLWGSVYVLIRNSDVYDFQSEIAVGCFGYVEKCLHQFNNDYELLQHLDEYEKARSFAYEILDKHSYESMVFSFRPLRFKEWFTDEEIELIEEGREYKGHTVIW